MQFRSTLAVLSLSLVCLAPRASFADTLTLTSANGPVVDGVYTYPYQFTITGPGGTNSGVSLSCLNFDREVFVGESWTVDPTLVSSMTLGNTYDGESALDFRADALLFSQYNQTTAGAPTNAQIQFAIWSVMDPSMTSANTGGALDAVAQSLASKALLDAQSMQASDFTNYIAFLPSGTYARGKEPQIFLTDPPPSSVTPEPSSLILLGTGLLGMCGAARRRLVRA